MQYMCKLWYDWCAWNEMQQMLWCNSVQFLKILSSFLYKAPYMDRNETSGFPDPNNYGMGYSVCFGGVVSVTWLSKWYPN